MRSASSAELSDVAAPDRPRAPAAYLQGPVGACGALLVFAVVVLAIFDVSPGQSLLYLAYQLGYVVVPGVAALLAITGRRAVGVEELAIGIGLGYALDVLAFIVCGAAGVPGWFAVYPVVVLALSLPFARVAPTTWQALRRQSISWWMLALLVAVPLGFLANSILDTPLPRQIGSLRGYSTDMLWATSVTAEAMHHWPITIPGFVGRSLHYHVFAFFEMAGTSRVTGLDPWLVNFRLHPVWTLGAASFELFAVARVLSRRAAAGPLAVFFFFVVPAFVPWSTAGSELNYLMYQSATFATGLVVWIPLLLLIRHALAGTAAGWRRGSVWIVGALVAAVAAGAKAPLLILAGSGLALVAVGAVFRARGLLPRVLAAGGGILALFLAAWLWLYRSSGDTGVSLHPFDSFKEGQPFALIAHHLPGALLDPFWLVAAVVLTLKLLAGVLPGVAAAVRFVPARLDVGVLGAMLLAGFVFLFAFSNAGESQRYFEWYALVAGAVLAAVGVAELVPRVVGPVSVRPSILIATGVAVLVAWAVEAPLDHSKSVWLNIGHSGGPSAEYVGFRWIAQHTSPNDVLAVDARSDPSSCFQTAFAERRAMLDCTIGIAPERNAGTFSSLGDLMSPQVFAQVQERVQLNDAIFDRGDRAALSAAARRFGVRYVVVDLASGGTRTQVGKLRAAATQVFANPAVVVFRVAGA